MNRITFVDKKGYIVAVIYNSIEDEKTAIWAASLSVVNKYTYVKLERV